MQNMQRMTVAAINFLMIINKLKTGNTIRFYYSASSHTMSF